MNKKLKLKMMTKH